MIPLNSELTGILIKPDSHRNDVHLEIINDIVNEGFKVLLQKDLALSKKDIKFLYPKECTIPIGEQKLVDYLTSSHVTFVLLKSTLVAQQDAINRLQKIKGDKLKRTGLRHIYNTIKITENDILEKNSVYYNYLMINNLHVFDTLESIINFMQRFKLDILYKQKYK